MRTTQISQAALEVLNQSSVEGNLVRLPETQLDRKLYLDVNKILDGIGGKWNRKEKAHVFPDSPAERLDAVIVAGEIVLPKKNGFFPTPAELAERMVHLAKIDLHNSVLEPSGGTGNILNAMKRVVEPDWYETLSVEACEIDPERRTHLWALGFNVVADDFLKHQKSYDRIIMNPPFEMCQDIRHVEHAWSLLNPGGRLVAVMSAGVTFRREAAFVRDLIDYQGFLETNAPGTFKESGTMVNTVTVVLNKP